MVTAHEASEAGMTDKDKKNDRRGVRRQAKRGQAVTVHDVARHAGVSSMTVSRVVNRSESVREDMRERVLAAIEELNYVPNLAARAARSGAVRIGALFSNPNSSNLGNFLIGAFTESGRLGCQLLIEPSAAHASPIAAVNALIAANADGIILPPPLCDSIEVIEHLSRTDIPALCFATAQPRPYVSAVLIDDYEGARAMTRHLLSLGHRDIAFVRGDPRHSPAMRREEGFRMAMAEAGIALRPEWVIDGDFSYRSGLEAGAALLTADRRPSAIFASNDEMASAIMARAHGYRIHVPEELSIAGFDDNPIAMTVWPGLTTVHQPIAEMAATAVALMHETIRRRRAGEDAPVKHIVAKFALVERESTAPPQR